MGFCQARPGPFRQARTSLSGASILVEVFGVEGHAHLLGGRSLDWGISFKMVTGILPVRIRGDFGNGGIIFPRPKVPKRPFWVSLAVGPPSKSVIRAQKHLFEPQ